jgi:hypothetical protein
MAKLLLRCYCRDWAAPGFLIQEQSEFSGKIEAPKKGDLP